MDELTAVARARQFIRQIGINSIPVEVALCLRAAKAVLKIRNDLPDDVSGNTTSISGHHCIFVNGRHTAERQRFTVLHEIAHILLHIPSIHESLIKTNILMGYAKRPPEETWCDAFAAECLLPYDFFKPDVDRYPTEFSSIEELAASYEASLTSTGSRFAVVNDSPCAFVLSESGVVRYVSYSRSMRELNCWIKTGMPIPPGSAAHEIRSKHLVDGPVEVEAELWLDDSRNDGMFLLEHARLLPEWDQTLSLLRFDESSDSIDSSSDSTDDSGGLEELDGCLQWPSRSRRR